MVEIVSNLVLMKGKTINVKAIDFGLAKIIGGDESTEPLSHEGFL
jgi:hypothetical protein